MKKIIKLLLVLCLTQIPFLVKSNNLRITNVGFANINPTTQTVNVKFTISWENSWRDSINWDAAWVFARYKHPVTGFWWPIKFNPGSGVNGTGTNATVQVVADSMGSFVYRNQISNGVFADTNITMTWKYGKDGLSNLSNIEIRLMAMEMVYIPEGPFQLAFNQDNIFKYATYLRNASNRDSTTYPIGGFQRVRILSSNYIIPTIDTSIISLELITWRENYNNNKYFGFSVPNDTIIIKGNLGIDSNKDGIIDNLNYPTGYSSFYIMKYELSEQQYADFLNTIVSTQSLGIGIAGKNITFNNGVYNSFTPNRACNFATSNRIFAYGDWAGMRPMTFMEFEKSFRGPISEFLDIDYQFKELENVSSSFFASENGTENIYPEAVFAPGINGDSVFLIRWTGFTISGSNNNFLRSGIKATNTSNRKISNASYYGVFDLTSNVAEPYMPPTKLQFTKINGDGNINSNGLTNISSWNNLGAYYSVYGINGNSSLNDNLSSDPNYSSHTRGFRFVRSAE
jgi:hypothetical protein